MDVFKDAVWPLVIKNSCTQQLSFKIIILSRSNHIYRLSGDVKSTPKQGVAIEPLSVSDTMTMVRNQK